MTRALVYTHHYPSPEAPSRATYSYHTYRALMRHCALRVVGPIPWWWRLKTPHMWIEPLHDASSGIDALFPSYLSVPAFWPLHGVAVAASTAMLVRRIKREFPFDLILAATAYPDAVAAAHLARLFDVPFMVTVLGSDVNKSGMHAALRPQIAWALKRAGRVIAVSAALGDRVAEMGVERSKIAVVRNGVDGEAFRIRDMREARARLDLPQDRPVVTYVGNMLPVKGVDVLVEAVGRMKEIEDAPPIYVNMVGGGDLLEQLKSRAQALGVADRIRFAGRVLPTAVPDQITACDVLCLPSREEGCPNVVLEALASGKPVVASRTGGVPELLRETNGILVTPEDPDGLAHALVKAVKRSWDPEALRRTVPSLSWNDVGDTYARLIGEVMAERRG